MYWVQNGHHLKKEKKKGCVSVGVGAHVHQRTHVCMYVYVCGCMCVLYINKCVLYVLNTKEWLLLTSKCW